METYKEHGWCLTIVNLFWVDYHGIPCLWPKLCQSHDNVTCDMQSKDVESQVLMWRALVKVMKANVSLTCHNLKGSSLIVLKQIGMLSTLCFAHHETLPNHYITKKKLVFSIRFNPWRFTPIGLFGCHTCEQNTWKFTKTTRIPKHLMTQMQNLNLSIFNGIHLE